MKDLISIIVPVYNVCNYLEECLDSIINQTYKLWECILVDDGSTDNSGEICDEYCKKDNRFRVIHKENGGLSSARNAGLEIIGKCEYVCFVDSDDCLDKHFLENAIGIAKKYDTDVVQVGYTRDYENLGSGEVDNVECMTAEQVFDDSLRFSKYNPMVWDKLYKIHIIKNLRFNETCYVLEDVDFSARVMQNCTCTFSEYKGYYYRVTPNSLATQGLNTRKLIGSITSQNLCIQLLRETDIEDNAYQFKYESLFNWLVRTANQDGWKELYHIIQKQILNDIIHIIRSRGITLKMKILLYACGISPLLAHLVCKIRRQ